MACNNPPTKDSPQDSLCNEDTCKVSFVVHDEETQCSTEISDQGSPFFEATLPRSRCAWPAIPNDGRSLQSDRDQIEVRGGVLGRPNSLHMGRPNGFGVVRQNSPNGNRMVGSSGPSGLSGTVEVEAAQRAVAVDQNLVYGSFHLSVIVCVLLALLDSKHLLRSSSEGTIVAPTPSRQPLQLR